MRRPRRSTLLTWVSLTFLLGALILTILQLVAFSRRRADYPSGLVIAGVPVGGLDRQEAIDRLLEVYSNPVELHYGEALIQVNPVVFDFELNLEAMLAAADLERTETSFWSGFWDFLWDRRTQPEAVPLSATYSEERLLQYLQTEITPRYDQPATSPRPAVGTVNFIPGIPGTTLNEEETVLLIENALFSDTERVVFLPLERSLPPRLAFENLKFFITQTVDRAGFEGLVGGYLLDLNTAQEVHFVYEQGEFLSTEPDVAFTAASIIKIPIMVSIFARIQDESDTETMKLLKDMIELSGNDPADWVLQRVIDENLGPIAVTEDMRLLGFENTFLAGHFYVGAPLLQAYDTPANTRLDINTNPDFYNQTSTAEIGQMLAEIYHCAQDGGGSLPLVFDGAITQAECQLMLSYLARNRIGVLIEAGAPEGTQVAHKHGWVTDSAGIINTIGDAGIVYSPGGNYVLVVFLYHPVQLIWEPASGLIAQISQAVYNYYNLTQP